MLRGGRDSAAVPVPEMLTRDDMVCEECRDYDEDEDEDDDDGSEQGSGDDERTMNRDHERALASSSPSPTGSTLGKTSPLSSSTSSRIKAAPPRSPRQAALEELCAELVATGDSLRGIFN